MKSPKSSIVNTLGVCVWETDNTEHSEFSVCCCKGICDLAYLEHRETERNWMYKFMRLLAKREKAVSQVFLCITEGLELVYNVIVASPTLWQDFCTVFHEQEITL